MARLTGKFRLRGVSFSSPWLAFILASCGGGARQPVTPANIVTTADADGRYAKLEGNGVLTALGGRDDLTGLRFGEDSILVANGGTVISPLSTLLFYASDPSDILSKTGIQAALDGAGITDLATFDAGALSIGLGGSVADEVV